jgi:hypothetical protein
VTDQTALTMESTPNNQRPESLTCPNCGHVMRWRKGKRVCKTCGCEV